MSPGDKLLDMMPAHTLTAAALLARAAKIERDTLLYGISIVDEQGRRIDPRDFYAQPEEGEQHGRDRA